MTRRGRAWLFAAAVTLAAVVVLACASARTVSAEPSTFPGVAAWSSHLNGWIVTIPASQAGQYPRIASTENGGRSWVTIYRSRLPGTIRAILPTSARVGLAALSVLVDHRELTANRMIVTLNDGNSWHRLPAGDFWEYMNGSGHDLYVLDNPNHSPTNPTTLYRVTPWPSLTPHLRPEATLTAGFYSFDAQDLKLVPGGIAALELATDSAVPFALLIDRNGATRLSHPPSVNNTNAAWCGVRSFSIDWPSVTVVTDWAPQRQEDSCSAPPQPVVYQSRDSGRTWRVIGTPPAANATTTTRRTEG